MDIFNNRIGLFSKLSLRMRDIIRILLTLVLVVIISILPSLSNKNKFKIKLVVSGMINKIIIFVLSVLPL